MYDIKISLFLDLMNAGYKNAYVSVFDFYSPLNNSYTRVEIVLPNVGRLCLYQTFVDVLDEQIPKIEIFYSMANANNITTKIRNQSLAKYATHIIYNCKKYFESHPEYMTDSNGAHKIIDFNNKFVREQYEHRRATQRGLMAILSRQK